MLPDLGFSLPIFFSPIMGESTTCWLHRLAHANCLNPDDLFFRKQHENSGERIWSFDLLIPNMRYRLISKEQFNTGLSLPKTMSNGLLLDSSISIHKPVYRYCPDCLRDAPIFHIKREWEYSWNTFCPIHQTYLSNECWSCEIYSTSLFNRDILLNKSDWEIPWGTCKHCEKSLVDDSREHASQMDPAIVDLLWCKINQTNQLIKQAHLEPDNDLDVSLALQVADILIECHPNDRIELHLFLLNHGIEIDKYIDSHSPGLKTVSDGVANIPPESAIAIAWHIIEQKWDVYERILDHMWLTRVRSNPASGKRRRINY